MHASVICYFLNIFSTRILKSTGCLGINFKQEHIFLVAHSTATLPHLRRFRVWEDSTDAGFKRTGFEGLDSVELLIPGKA
jgi:hypothetical protein